MSGSDALARARKHARTIGRHLSDALDAHASGDHETVAHQLRAAQRAHTWLGSAHADLESEIEDGPDPIANPTGAMGAQTSDGCEPRNASDAVVVNRLLGSFRTAARGAKR
jgi:hypothetical protein